MAELLTQEHLQRLMEYNPETGLWRWKVYESPRSRRDWFPGSSHTDGYKTIMIWGRSYKAHRLAWLYIYGEFPGGEIDHLNGDKADNRITNLRVVDRSLNVFSTGLKSNSSSGITGVYYRSGFKKPWHTQIRRKGKTKTKSFETKEEAVEWRRVEELVMFHELSIKSSKGA